MICVVPKTLCFALLCSLLAVQATADESSAEGKQLAFFETKIRPVLVDHCYKCHSADTQEVGGKLLLDSREGLLRGGEAGAAIVPGKPQESLILLAMKHDGIEMPPSGPLPESIIHDFAKWIEAGAVDPRTGVESQQQDAKQNAEARWSYQPVQSPALPDVADTQWVRDSLDRFVLAKIEGAGLSPASDAPPKMLARRLYYDLIGLPPSLQQTLDFETACVENRELAITELVDELLNRPEFGERWGRHWLDVARYGESNGNDGLGRNPTFPHAWRYRDYVIDAFNQDTPYDRFLMEQIAGDLLPADSAEQRDRNRIATGFLALAAKPAKAMNNDFEMDVVADQIDVIGTGIMGISVACARCHDHKFDPIPTREYYALAGIFTSSETLWGVAANEGLTAPKTGLHVLESAPKRLPPEDFEETVLVRDSNTGVPRAIPKPPWPVGTPLAMGVRDRKEPADCKINIKGDSKKLGEAVARGFISACSSPDSPDATIDSKQSGRVELARWLTSGKHPQTARVMINRIWLHLFGTGIVGTPDDFGVYGERPTHPELLDHLATRFVDQGWSIKSMIRAIVLSRTYQQTSQISDDTNSDAAAAPNLLIGHARRRLDAESLRDSMLQVSGNLDLTPADGSIIRFRDILVNLAGSLHEPSNHRSVYLCYLRSSPPPELAAFDLPEFTSVTGQRDISTVPGQALHLFNNPFVIQQSESFAERVMSAASDRQQRIEFAWREALNRDATVQEIQEALNFIRTTEQKSGPEPEPAAWVALCQALLMTNEFRYID